MRPLLSNPLSTYTPAWVTVTTLPLTSAPSPEIVLPPSESAMLTASLSSQAPDLSRSEYSGSNAATSSAASGISTFSVPPAAFSVCCTSCVCCGSVDSVSCVDCAVQPAIVRVSVSAVASARSFCFAFFIIIRISPFIILSKTLLQLVFAAHRAAEADAQVAVAAAQLVEKRLLQRLVL